MQLSQNLNVPVISAFLIGLLGATAPCQLSTNLGAIGFLANKGLDIRKLVKNTFWYTSGKILVFLFYGLLIITFKINFQQKFIFVFSFARKVTGPFVIVVGLSLLGIVKSKLFLGKSLMDNFDTYSSKLKVFNPAFIMGIFFSFAFCPTLFWLFVGLIVPLSLKSSIGLIYPVIFAFGTLVTMVIILLILGLRKKRNENTIRLFRKIERVVRTIGGILIILFGVIDTIIYFFL